MLSMKSLTGGNGKGEGEKVRNEPLFGDLHATWNLKFGTLNLHSGQPIG